jgi:transcriptional regulator with XRE-family HTH domain
LPQVHQAREALGASLRALRLAAGLRGKELAAAVGWPPSRVSRLELGQQTPTRSDLAEWVQACSASTAALDDLTAQLAQVETFYRDWRRQLRAGVHARQRSLADEEGRTRVLRGFEPLLIPGLVQTEAYAREMLRQTARELRLPPDVDDAVRARMLRQDVLYQPGKRFHLVVSEAALRLGTAPADVMRTQLDRLAAATFMDRLRLGVIPFGTLLLSAPQHGFRVHDRRMVYVETVTAELRLTHPAARAAS